MHLDKIWWFHLDHPRNSWNTRIFGGGFSLNYLGWYHDTPRDVAVILRPVHSICQGTGKCMRLCTNIIRENAKIQFLTHKLDAGYPESPRQLYFDVFISQTMDTFYTRQLLHQAPFTIFFCTRHLLYQTPSTPDTCYTRQLLQQTTFTPGTLYTRNLLHQTTFKEQPLRSSHPQRLSSL